MQNNIQEIVFDEVKSKFFYKITEKEYNGSRISTIKSASTRRGFCSRIIAEGVALDLLLEENEKIDTDAYEIVSSSSTDSRQEYDPNPYDASVSAIFYRRQ